MEVQRSSAARTVQVRDVPVPGFPAVHHPGWTHGFPWLVQGTTTRAVGDAATEFDLRLFGEGRPTPPVTARWEALRTTTGLPVAVHARQVHGAVVRGHDRAAADEVAAGMRIPEECDGHVTDAAGILLAVSIADCVPVSVVNPLTRRIGLLHAGWRGAAAGILERGLSEVAVGGARAGLLVHLGPSICGRCYQVGPEVFEALGRPGPSCPEPIDLRAVLAERAVAAGVDPAGVSVSERCPRCEPEVFFSHRGGDTGRQVAYLGVRG